VTDRKSVSYIENGPAHLANSSVSQSTHRSIVFVAFVIHKKFELCLPKNTSDISPARAGELTYTMYELEKYLPDSTIAQRSILVMTDEQQQLYLAITAET